MRLCIQISSEFVQIDHVLGAYGVIWLNQLELDAAFVDQFAQMLIRLDVREIVFPNFT